MKVQELIKELQDRDPEASVHFVYNYGDHWHTHVAPEVRGDGYVKHSDYHNMPKVVDDDVADDDPKAEEVVLLLPY